MELVAVYRSAQARRRVAVPPTLTAVNQIQYGCPAGFSDTNTSQPNQLSHKSDAEGTSDRCVTIRNEKVVLLYEKLFRMELL